MHDPLTEAQAPELPLIVRWNVNDLAKRGRVAVIGTAVTFDDTANDHREVIRSTTFGTRSTLMPPPLIDGHPEDGEPETLLGRGVVAAATAAGLVCVWELHQTVNTFDRLTEAMLDGRAGLSIMFTPGKAQPASIRGQRVTEHQSGELQHVALVDDPSYSNARVTGFVGGHAALLHRPGRGVESLTGRAALDAERQQVATANYAATHNPALILAMAPSVQATMFAVHEAAYGRGDAAAEVGAGEA